LTGMGEGKQQQKREKSCCAPGKSEKQKNKGPAQVVPTELEGEEL